MDNIKIKFPDGKEKEFEKGITPYQIAQSISDRLAEEATRSKSEWVNNRYAKTYSKGQ
ncbi:MAG: TGS domain-containing protein [Ignavibacteriaceae bacterium]|nr:TGS domain-containing protein [Ignavibacteriaceae bacterium]